MQKKNNNKKKICRQKPKTIFPHFLQKIQYVLKSPQCSKTKSN